MITFTLCGRPAESCEKTLPRKRALGTRHERNGADVGAWHDGVAGTAAVRDQQGCRKQGSVGAPGGYADCPAEAVGSRLNVVKPEVSLSIGGGLCPDGEIAIRSLQTHCYDSVYGSSGLGIHDCSRNGCCAIAAGGRSAGPSRSSARDALSFFALRMSLKDNDGAVD